MKAMTPSTSAETPQGMPESVKAIAKAFAETARNMGLHNASGSFRPEYNVWGAEVSWKWEQGRHGEDSNKISITSTFYIHERVND